MTFFKRLLKDFWYSNILDKIAMIIISLAVMFIIGLFGIGIYLAPWLLILVVFFWAYMRIVNKYIN